ncbi:major facilitator superfamily domain-containing protein [Jimgerdemannia flammicorona]|uniref:Major facilitator superfamily domain-containing protein n=1 Tax=Jimgerdemannia flammicorona TaxID=994334 RepID=A0A433Q902_9FUNG|nr:major facilitator superfamily domain-containing protein [Jimgerdemannia flammicorona]
MEEAETETQNATPACSPDWHFRARATPAAIIDKHNGRAKQRKKKKKKSPAGAIPIAVARSPPTSSPSLPLPPPPPLSIMHGNTTVILSSLLLSLASFAFSYNSGIYPVVRASLSRPATDPSLLTDDAFQLSHLLVSVLSAALAAPALCDRLGRRITMLLAAVLLTLAGAIQSSSDGIVHYFVGRITNAIAGGTMWVAVFLYEVEVVPKKWRGAAICLQVGRIGVGIRIGPACWQVMSNEHAELIVARSYGGGGAILCVGVYLIPSSPRWLLSRGRDQAALIVLAKLRADGDPGAPDVVDEYDGVKRMVNPDRQERAQWADLLHGTNLRRLVLATLLHVFAGLAFVEGIQAWVAELGVAGGQVPSAGGGTVVWAIAAVFMYAVPAMSVVVVDKIGRRALIVGGTCVMGKCGE